MLKVAATLLALTAAPALAQDKTVGPNSRAEATKIIADLRKIVSPDGLQATERVRIGGTIR